jgi:formiminotetrahydrofolate cyclodeaminase
VVTNAEARLGDWLDKLAARTPTPSGGAAAAVALAAAAALASMVARFSSDLLVDSEELAGAADSARCRALELASADEAVVAAVVPASAGAGDHDGARIGPLDAHAAALQAAHVPLEMVRLAAELRPLLDRLHRDGNQRLAGDAQVGIELLVGAAAGAAALVRIDAERLDGPERYELLAALVAAEEQTRGTGPGRSLRRVGE